MPFEESWYDEAERIILIYTDSKFTIEEMQVVAEAVRAKVRSKSHIVNVIIDATNSRFLPMGYLLQTMRYLSSSPRNGGILVFIRPNSMLVSMFETLLRIVTNQRHRVFMVQSIDEGLAHIAAHTPRNDDSVSA